MVKILAVFLPFTWSAVMKVAFHLENQHEQIAVLKLFDRRYCPGLRESYELPSWTSELDNDHLRYISQGGARDFILWLETFRDDEIVDGSAWDSAKNEAWTQNICRDNGLR